MQATDLQATLQKFPRLARPAAEDADLERRIANFLLHQKVPHCHQVHANAHSGTVVVTGKLQSRHEKWLCLNTCQRVAGVVRLIDEVVLPQAADEARNRRGHSRAA